MAKKGTKAAPEVKKILILAANPRDTDPLRLDQEVREIDEGLRRSKHRDRFELVQRWAVRTVDLRRALLDEEPQIVHFCEHGSNQSKLSREKNRRHVLYESTDDANGGIVLEDEQGRSTVVGKAALAELVGILKEGIECVVLNACYSEAQAEALAEHIPYVIGMRKAIGDKAAIEFSIGFYDGLGAGKSVEHAFKLGCNAIHLKDIPEHLTPVIMKQPDAPEYLLPVLGRSSPSAETDTPASVRNTVSQKSEVSGGSNYQAGRDIIVQHPGEPSKPDSLPKKITLWLTLIIALLTILSMIFDLPQKFEDAFVPASTRFFGTVIDQNGAQVTGAMIQVRNKEGDVSLIGEGTTTSQGSFSFMVKAKPKETVWVTVEKDGYIGFKDYVALLGNKRLLLRRK